MAAGGAAVGTGAGAEVAAGVGFGAGVLLLSGLGLELEELELSDDDEDSFLAGFFFLGSDFSAGRGAAPAMLVVIEAVASSTVSVPAALDLAGVLPPSSEPLEAFATPKARRKATSTAPTVIPI